MRENTAVWSTRRSDCVGEGRPAGSNDDNPQADQPLRQQQHPPRRPSPPPPATAGGGVPDLVPLGQHTHGGRTTDRDQ